MTIANINRPMLCLRTAFDTLPAHIPMTQVEAMAVLQPQLQQAPVSGAVKGRAYPLNPLCDAPIYVT